MLLNKLGKGRAKRNVEGDLINGELKWSTSSQIKNI